MAARDDFDFGSSVKVIEIFFPEYSDSEKSSYRGGIELKVRWEGDCLQFERFLPDVTPEWCERSKNRIDEFRRKNLNIPCVMPADFCRAQDRVWLFRSPFAPYGNLEFFLAMNTFNKTQLTIALIACYHSAVGLANLHMHGFVHRFVSPRNIFIGKDFRCGLCFQYVREVGNESQPQTYLPWLEELPPWIRDKLRPSDEGRGMVVLWEEVFDNDFKQDVDVWMWGHTFERVVQKGTKVRDTFKELIDKCTALDADDRISAKEICFWFERAMALAGDSIDKVLWGNALRQVKDTVDDPWGCTREDLEEIAKKSNGDDSVLLYPRLLYCKMTADNSVKDKIKRNVDEGIRELMRKIGLDKE